MNIDFPLHFDSRGRTAECDDATHVREMLEQLLFTNAGERVNRPDFGSGLQQLVFAPNSPELAAALQFTTRAAIQQWLGDVLDLQALEVTADDSTLRILVRYALRRTGEVRNETFAGSTS
jgi:uncharacterized protein